MTTEPSTDPTEHRGSVPEPRGWAGHRGNPLVGQVVFLGLCLVGGVVAAVIGGLVWAHVSHPPSALVASHGEVLLAEQGLNQQTAVTGWFMVVGVVAGAVCGIVVGLLGRKWGWVSVLGVLLLCAIASVGSSWLGHHVFSPNPKDQLGHVKVGDMVHLSAVVTSNVAYLSWLVGGMAGAFAAIFTWRDGEASPPVPPTATTVASGSA
ncbi:MAG: hypothetical protein ACRDPG_04135 [Nocardioidaceae bacterium]